MTVAFVGAAAPHKGWKTYAELARRNALSGEYRFLHLGMPDTSNPDIEHVHVAVLADDRSAMQEALLKHGVDVVVNWSLCYETFSFTTMEAIAAGVFVIARRLSGNAAAMIADVGRGCLLDTDDDLFSLFETKKIKSLVRNAFSRKVEIQTVHHHGITADILLQAPAS